MGAILPSQSDLIKSGALRTTVGTGVGAVVVAIGTAINPVFDAVVGKDAPSWVKAIILIAAIMAWAVIAAADALARGYAAGRAAPQVTPAPAGLSAKYIPGRNDPEYRVAAFELTPGSDALRCLVTRTREAPSWKDAKDLEFT
jgi:hypothetical protein